MGDRALIVFKKDEEISPAVYLHHDGHNVHTWLRELAERMIGREGDLPYAVARFVGICHTHIPGNLSLGLFADATDIVADPINASHGDHGVIIVDVADFSYTQHGETSGCELEGRKNGKKTVRRSKAAKR